MSLKVLLIEDEEPIREMLRYSLVQKGFEVLQAESAKQGREILLKVRPDIIILDWMMPGESGLEFLKRLKQDEILAEIPTMMLTARVEEMDKVRGLEGGADDYMTKPVSIREFHARIKALIRRASPQSEQQQLESLGIKINLATQQLYLDDDLVSIGSTELNLLKFFLTHKNKIYSRSQLLDYVWGQGAFLEERTVDVHMLRLRKILKVSDKSKYFTTVRGMGYMFATDNQG